jgi:hypothetical protein
MQCTRVDNPYHPVRNEKCWEYDSEPSSACKTKEQIRKKSHDETLMHSKVGVIDQRRPNERREHSVPVLWDTQGDNTVEYGLLYASFALSRIMFLLYASLQKQTRHCSNPQY